MKPVLGGNTHILPLWLFSAMVVTIKVKTKCFLLEEEELTQEEQHPPLPLPWTGRG